MQPALSAFYGISFLVTAIAFGFALYLHLWVRRQKSCTEEVRSAARLIREGANTFLRREYAMLARFAAAAAVIIFV
ncbi:MAG: sodium/proton-translocating pyrophosphatase, partial [Eubacteriales bacterium]